MDDDLSFSERYGTQDLYVITVDKYSILIGNHDICEGEEDIYTDEIKEYGDIFVVICEKFNNTHMEIIRENKQLVKFKFSQDKKLLFLQVYDSENNFYEDEEYVHNYIYNLSSRKKIFDIKTLYNEDIEYSLKWKEKDNRFLLKNKDANKIICTFTINDNNVDFIKN